MAGLSLAERLAALKLPPMEDLDDPVPQEEAPEIGYKAQYAYPKPDERLFLAFYTPWILRPLEFDWFVYRDFKPFILGDAIYVLNTFDRLSIDRIFFLYLKKIRPKSMRDFARLTHFCGHIEIYIPHFYQERIEALIHTIKT